MARRRNMNSGTKFFQASVAIGAAAEGATCYRDGDGIAVPQQFTTPAQCPQLKSITVMGDAGFVRISLYTRTPRGNLNGQQLEWDNDLIGHLVARVGQKVNIARYNAELFSIVGNDSTPTSTSAVFHPVIVE